MGLLLRGHRGFCLCAHPALAGNILFENSIAKHYLDWPLVDVRNPVVSIKERIAASAWIKSQFDPELTPKSIKDFLLSNADNCHDAFPIQTRKIVDCRRIPSDFPVLIPLPCNSRSARPIALATKSSNTFN